MRLVQTGVQFVLLKKQVVFGIKKKQSTILIIWSFWQVCTHYSRLFNILLKVDNITAIACINKMGSTKNKKLASLSKAIWTLCEDRNIFLYASYVRSRDNKGDYESRSSKIETEYALCDRAFKIITVRLGSPSIDLFASYMNTKCPLYVSWRSDPGSIAIDAFSLSWTDLNFYAFLPFPLILKVIKKLIFDRAEGIIIVPLWKNQPWYPLFIECLTEPPIYFDPA